jgi:hypothetical protein
MDIPVEEVEVPRCHRAKNPVDQSTEIQNKRISVIINNHRGISGYS